MKSFARNFRYWLPALLWLGVIAFESFRLSSAVTGSWLWRALQFLRVDISGQTFAELHHFLRKTGHLTGYGLLCLLLFRSWFHTLFDMRGTAFTKASRQPARAEPNSRGKSGRLGPRWRCAGLAVSMTLLTAILDEWHQSFDPTRTGTPWDVALDLAGGVCFLLIALFVFKLWQRQPAEELAEVSA